MFDLFRTLFRVFMRQLRSLFGVAPEDTSSSAPPDLDDPALARFRQVIRQAELPSEAMPALPPIYEQRKGGLFSYQERLFYRTLQEVVDNQYQIFAKVRMADILWLSNEIQDRKYHNNQILCKHLDFVLCDKSDIKPVLIIELDDSSHRRYDRRESDEFKDRVFEMVGLPLLRVQVEQTYSTEKLKAQIQEKLSLQKEPADADDPRG